MHDVWIKPFGPQWDAFENSLEENMAIFSTEAALHIEVMKRKNPDPGYVYAIKNVDIQRRQITIGLVKGVSQ